MSNVELCTIEEYRDGLAERVQAQQIAIHGIYTATARFRESPFSEVAARYPVVVEDITVSGEGDTLIHTARVDQDFRKSEAGVYAPIVDGLIYCLANEVQFTLSNHETGLRATGAAKHFYLRDIADPIDLGIATMLSALDVRELEGAGV